MKAKNHLHISNRFQAITERIPNAPCIIQGDSILSYADVELHSDRLAKAYLDAGIERGDTVAIMGRNSAGYIEACLAAHKLACLPCNIDLKNSAHKVLYLLKNSSATVLVIDAEFYPVYQELAENLSFIKLLVIIGKLKEKSLPANAISYKKIVSFGPYLEPELIDWRPPNNDDPQFLIYSGSSGVPKGVLWGAGFLTHAHRWVESIAQAFIPKLASAPKAIFSPRRGKDKIVLMLLRSFVFRKLISKPAVQQLAIKLVTRSYRTVSQGHLKRAANRAKLSRSTPNITLLVGDLAKGKNWFHCFFTLLAGDPVVLLENSQTDAKEIWYTVEKRSVRTLIIAGDLHARALAKILEDISCDTGSLAFIHSVGTPWSVVSKRKLLDFIPQAIFVDNYAVAEGLVFSQVSLSTDRLIESMQFDWSDRVVLLSEEGDPMSGLDDSTGELALSDMIPISYWRDDQRTETNFIDLDGKA